MLEWIVEKWNNFMNWLSKLWTPEEVNRPPVQRPVQVENIKGTQRDAISLMLANRGVKEDFNTLKEKAFADKDSAKQLLKRTDLKGRVSSEELCQIIYNHRKTINYSEISMSLAVNGLSLAKLAMDSPKNALLILKSRFMGELKTTEMAYIYFQHRRSELFTEELLKPKSPNEPHIPTLTEIKERSKNNGTFKTVNEIINSSPTLLNLLNRENPSREKPKPAKPPVEMPDFDPYEVIGVRRDATPSEIDKAYRRQALKFHPDLIQTEHESRMKNLNVAHDFLSDPEKRTAWDEAHPVAQNRP